MDRGAESLNIAFLRGTPGPRLGTRHLPEVVLPSNKQNRRVSQSLDPTYKSRTGLWSGVPAVVPGRWRARLRRLRLAANRQLMIHQAFRGSARSAAKQAGVVVYGFLPS